MTSNLPLRLLKSALKEGLIRRPSLNCPAVDPEEAMIPSAPVVRLDSARGLREPVIWLLKVRCPYCARTHIHGGGIDRTRVADFLGDRVTAAPTATRSPTRTASPPMTDTFRNLAPRRADAQRVEHLHALLGLRCEQRFRSGRDAGLLPGCQVPARPKRRPKRRQEGGTGQGEQQRGQGNDCGRSATIVCAASTRLRPAGHEAEEAAVK